MMRRGGTIFDIEFCRLPDGTAPVEEFLRGLDPKMRVKAVNSIALLEEFGYQQVTLPGSSTFSESAIGSF